MLRTNEHSLRARSRRSAGRSCRACQANESIHDCGMGGGRIEGDKGLRVAPLTEATSRPHDTPLPRSPWCPWRLRCSRCASCSRPRPSTISTSTSWTSMCVPSLPVLVVQLQPPTATSQLAHSECDGSGGNGLSLGAWGLTGPGVFKGGVLCRVVVAMSFASLMRLTPPADAAGRVSVRQGDPLQPARAGAARRPGHLPPG